MEEKSERLDLRAEKRVGVVASGRKSARQAPPLRLAERTPMIDLPLF